MRSSANRSTLQSWFPEGISDVFTLEALDWIAAIDARGTGRRPEIDGQAGLRDLAAAFAMLESDMTRREVAVEDVLAGAIEAYQRPINQVLGI